MSRTDTPEAILAQLQNAGSAYARKKPGAREQLLNLGYALVSAVELPSEAIQRMGWAEPARAAHCRIAVELNFFESLKESGSQGIGPKDLAAKTGADKVLIARTLKHLAAMNVIAESGTDKYVTTRLSNAFTEPRYRDGLIYTINYAHPTKLTDGPFQAAHKTELPFFAWLDQNPPYLQIFSSYMSAYRAGKPSWVDPGFYPVFERLVEGFDTKSGTDGVLLVDVGGGRGQDLQELRRSILSGGGIFEATGHDFFTPQPVKDARAYYLHSVLHDWSDDDCIKILEQLLINEIVVPDRNPTWPVTSMDQLMLALGAMRERTQSDWENIVKRAGFKIVQVYNYEMGSESLIEAELA
ncbi:putative O-methyltransferase [Hypoxylon sp. NC1633]|nr:putative O-methyltransferase [Hypoxylon sp. NC1633]